MQSPYSTEWLHSATQRLPAPASRESFDSEGKERVLILKVGFWGLQDSGWNFGGLEVIRAELCLEKVISGCIAAHPLPSKPVSYICLLTSFVLRANVIQKALEKPKSRL